MSGHVNPLIAYCRAAAAWLPNGAHDPQLVYAYAHQYNVLDTDENGHRASAFLTADSDRLLYHFLLNAEHAAQGLPMPPNQHPVSPLSHVPLVPQPPLPHGFHVVPMPSPDAMAEGGMDISPAFGGGYKRERTNSGPSPNGPPKRMLNWWGHYPPPHGGGGGI